MYEVRVYQTRDGKSPLLRWLKRLGDVKAQKAMDQRRFRIAEGNFGDHKSCGAGIWELRIEIGPGYRIYYALDGPRVVLLLWGGDKGSQVTDIRRATDYWKEWKERV